VLANFSWPLHQKILYNQYLWFLLSYSF
jgi:hypothetical protein